MTEMTWAREDRALMSTRVPKATRPSRYALTVTALILSHPLADRLVLRNPHSSEVDRWMLPFGAVIGELLPTSEECTLATLIAQLDELAKRQLSGRSLHAVKEEIEKQSSVTNLALEVEPIEESFALKLSKTAGVWTVHVFRYHIATGSSVAEGRILDDGSETCLIPLDRTRRPISSQGILRGVPVAPNVLNLLQDERIMQRLAKHGQARS
jgi:hypothetical protein